MKLEELARQSSIDARVSVSHLDLPPIGEERRIRSWAPVLAAAGVAAVVVAGRAFVISNRLGDDATPADQLPAVVEVPRLGLPESAGWDVTHAGELADLGQDFGERPVFTYYGTAGADDPFAGGDLLVATYDGADSDILDQEGEMVSVRGTTGTITSGADQGLPSDATALAWVEDGRFETLLVSRSLGSDELVDVAEALTFDSDGSVTIPTDVGLDRLATAHGSPFDQTARSGEGFLVAYESGGDFLVLSTWRGDLARDAVALRWFTPAPTAVTVGGQPGLLTRLDEAMPSDDGATGTSVMWAPRPGVVAAITHFGPGEAVDVVALADTVIELDDATWARYLALTGDMSAGADEFDEIFARADGSIADLDYTWVLGLRGDDLCFEMESRSAGIGSCQARVGIIPPVGSAATIDSGESEPLAHVVIAADPDVDEVVDRTGEYVIERSDADGVSWFVAIGPSTSEPVFDVIRDGRSVAVLDAEVDPTAVVEPWAPGDTPFVEELGLEGLQVVLSNSTGPETWYLGLRDDEQCLVVDFAGDADVRCEPLADIAVFGPFEAPDGERSFVSFIVPPDCADGITLEGVDHPFGGVGSGAHVVWPVAGTTAGGTATIAGGGAIPVSVDLPSPSGTADYPADPCGG